MPLSLAACFTVLLVPLLATGQSQSGVTYSCSCTGQIYARLDECTARCKLANRGRLGCFVGVCVKQGNSCGSIETPRPFIPGPQTVTLEKFDQPPESLNWDTSVCEQGRTGITKVNLNIAVRCDSENWVAELTGIVGVYVSVAKPVAENKRLTRASTTATNFCAQIKSVKDLARLTGMDHCPEFSWIDEKEILAHENVHVNHLQPALEAVALQIERDVKSIKVSTDKGKSRQEALKEMQMPLQGAKLKASELWGKKFTELSKHDEEEERATGNAMESRANEVTRKICDLARTKNWGSCDSCPR